MNITTLFRGLIMGAALYSHTAFSDTWLTKDLVLSSQGIEILNIESGAGDLAVSGSSSQQDIRVIARLNGRELNASDYTLSLTKHGSSATLIAEIVSDWTANNYIDLEVILPEDLKLDIQDRSGDIIIENMHNNVWVDDRSGDLTISDINGSVQVQDNSGDVTVRRISGYLLVEDKSGDITVSQIAGNVEIEDNSGDITVSSTGGDVTLADSSGDIEVIDTFGVVNVTDIGGDVDINGAQDANIDKSGGGDVSSKNINSRR